MAKLIPLKIQRNDHDGWNVINPHTNEIVEAFDEKSEAAEYVQSHRQNPNEDGWEPDYEWIMEQRAGDPEAGLDTMERRDERYMMGGCDY